MAYFCLKYLYSFNFWLRFNYNVLSGPNLEVAPFPLRNLEWHPSFPLFLHSLHPGWQLITVRWLLCIVCFLFRLPLDLELFEDRDWVSFIFSFPHFFPSLSSAWVPTLGWGLYSDNHHIFRPNRVPDAKQSNEHEESNGPTNESWIQGWVQTGPALSPSKVMWWFRKINIFSNLCILPYCYSLSGFTLWQRES